MIDPYQTVVPKLNIDQINFAMQDIPKEALVITPVKKPEPKVEPPKPKVEPPKPKVEPPKPKREPPKPKVQPPKPKAKEQPAKPKPKPRSKGRASLESVCIDHKGMLNHIISYLQNYVQPSRSKEYPSEESFKIGMLNKSFNKAVVSIYGKLNAANYACFLGVNEGVKMFDSTPRCIDDVKQGSMAMGLDLQK
jgi:hypothetical protein